MFCSSLKQTIEVLNVKPNGELAKLIDLDSSFDRLYHRFPVI